MGKSIYRKIATLLTSQYTPALKGIQKKWKAFHLLNKCVCRPTEVHYLQKSKSKQGPLRKCLNTAKSMTVNQGEKT